MPFGNYDSFEDCVAQNQGKKNPEAFCAAIKRQIEGGEHMQLGSQSGDKRMILDLEVFAAGFWVPKEGEPRYWTIDDLDGMVKAFDAGVPEAVHVKLGHTTAEFAQAVASALNVPVEVVEGEGEEGNGQISLGHMVSLRRRDDKLVADLETPTEIADLLMKGYEQVSPELLSNMSGHPWAMSAVALLGAERPAAKGMAGLAKAAVLVERKPSEVYVFKAQEGRLVLDPVELQEIGAALEQASKGKKAAPFIQRIWAEIKGRFQTAESNREDEMNLKELGKKLKFAEGVSDEAILAGVEQCMAVLAELRSALSMSPEASVEAVGAEAKKRFSEAAKVTTFSEELKTRDARIATLERAGHTAQYKEKVATLTAIQGTPDALAAKLMAIEEKMGPEAATERLAEWRTAQAFAEKAGVITRLGSSQGGASGSEADTKLAEYQKAGLTKPKAVAKLASEHPALFREYQAANQS